MKPIRSVTILGGGTAGWLSATILHHFLNERAAAEPVTVTVVESPNIPTVGVGEATVPGMPQLMHQLGVDEGEFMTRCNASFKLGVRFVHWTEEADGTPRQFVHPFNQPPDIEGVSVAEQFQFLGLARDDLTFNDFMCPNAAVIDAMKGPRGVADPDYHYLLRYAYHFDAALFAEFLRERGIARGIGHVHDNVVETHQDESGSFTHLHLKEGGLLPVELVIDCTGFRGMLLQQRLGEPFLPYGDSLLCDRALAVQIPHARDGVLEPCTRSTALGAGWSWRVPLHSRVGTGYVFSSAFRSDEEATREFLGFLRARGEAVEGAEPRALAMRVGRVRRSWVKNCIAVGLAGGFVEPLESTAIYMVDRVARWICKHFPRNGIDEARVDEFNRDMESLYAEIRDFIVLHYVTGNRQEPFWKAAREETRIPDRLRERLEQWRHRLPVAEDLGVTRLFNHWSYLFVLYSRGTFEAVDRPMGRLLPIDQWRAYEQQLEATKQALTQRLAGHHELVTRIRTRAKGTEVPDHVLSRLKRLRDAPMATVPVP